jgi:hypothetical protein
VLQWLGVIPLIFTAVGWVHQSTQPTRTDQAIADDRLLTLTLSDAERRKVIALVDSQGLSDAALDKSLAIDIDWTNAHPILR